MFRNRIFLEWLGALFVGCLLAGWAASVELTQRFDFQLQDLATSFVVGDADPDIALVTIDDASLAQVGSWPWPRDRHGRIVDQLSSSGARAIVLDVLFLEPTSPEQDTALIEAMERFGAVYLPHTFMPARNAQSGIEGMFPAEKLAEVAAAIGHVALDFDPDGAVRRVELLKRGSDPNGGDASFPHLTLQTFRSLTGNEPEVLEQFDSEFPRPIVPLRKVGSYSEVRASQVLRGEVPSSFFAGKTVFVGATAQGLGDTYPVPWSAGSAMSGVEIQANLYDNLKHGLFVQPVSKPVTILFSVLAVVILFVGFRLLSPGRLPAFFIAMLAGILAISLLLPGVTGHWSPPGAALLALLVSYPLWSWRRLSGVVAFLSRESGNLRNIGQTERVEMDGFDEIDREENRLENLVSLVRDRFRFIQTVIREIPDPIVVFDKDGRSALFNERAIGLFGEAQQDLTFQDLVSANRGRFDKDKRELAMEGGRIFTVARASLELTSGDAPSEIVQFHDITAIRNAERERREMLEFLSHDMRSPQVAIIGMAKDAGTPGRDDDRMARISEQAERTLKLADDFVQIARMAEAPLKQEEFDLAGLAEEAADRAHFMAKRFSITLQRAMPEEPTYVIGDPSLVARVIDNLLSNALKFSPEGSEVTLSVVRSPQDAGKIRLEISDQGPGLPPERARDPFRRFGPGDSSKGPSAGLGLAFVAEAARKHAAELAVESEPGQGACFRLDFPAA